MCNSFVSKKNKIGKNNHTAIFIGLFIVSEFNKNFSDKAFVLLSR